MGTSTLTQVIFFVKKLYFYIVTVGDVFFFFKHHRFYSAPAIYSLFVHISDKRQRDRLTNKSLVCTKLYLFYSSCQESCIY